MLFTAGELYGHQLDSSNFQTGISHIIFGDYGGDADIRKVRLVEELWNVQFKEQHKFRNSKNIAAATREFMEKLSATLDQQDRRQNADYIRCTQEFFELIILRVFALGLSPDECFTLLWIGYIRMHTDNQYENSEIISDVAAVMKLFKAHSADLILYVPAMIDRFIPLIKRHDGEIVRISAVSFNFRTGIS